MDDQPCSSRSPFPSTSRDTRKPKMAGGDSAPSSSVPPPTTSDVIAYGSSNYASELANERQKKWREAKGDRVPLDVEETNYAYRLAAALVRPNHMHFDLGDTITTFIGRIAETLENFLSDIGPEDRKKFFRHLSVAKDGKIGVVRLRREIEFLLNKADYVDAGDEEKAYRARLLSLDPNLNRDRELRDEVLRLHREGRKGFRPDGQHESRFAAMKGDENQRDCERSVEKSKRLGRRTTAAKTYFELINSQEAQQIDAKAASYQKATTTKLPAWLEMATKEATGPWNGSYEDTLLKKSGNYSIDLKWPFPNATKEEHVVTGIRTASKPFDSHFTLNEWNGKKNKTPWGLDDELTAARLKRMEYGAIDPETSESEERSEDSEEEERDDTGIKETFEEMTVGDNGDNMDQTPPMLTNESIAVDEPVQCMTDEPVELAPVDRPMEDVIEYETGDLVVDENYTEETPQEMQPMIVDEVEEELDVISVDGAVQSVQPSISHQVLMPLEVITDEAKEKKRGPGRPRKKSSTEEKKTSPTEAPARTMQDYELALMLQELSESSSTHSSSAPPSGPSSTISTSSVDTKPLNVSVPPDPTPFPAPTQPSQPLVPRTKKTSPVPSVAQPPPTVPPQPSTAPAPRPITKKASPLATTPPSSSTAVSTVPQPPVNSTPVPSTVPSTHNPTPSVETVRPSANPSPVASTVPSVSIPPMKVVKVTASPPSDHSHYQAKLTGVKRTPVLMMKRATAAKPKPPPKAIPRVGMKKNEPRPTLTIPEEVVVNLDYMDFQIIKGSPAAEKLKELYYKGQAADYANMRNRCDQLYYALKYWPLTKFPITDLPPFHESSRRQVLEFLGLEHFEPLVNVGGRFDKQILDQLHRRKHIGMRKAHEDNKDMYDAEGEFRFRRIPPSEMDEFIKTSPFVAKKKLSPVNSRKKTTEKKSPPTRKAGDVVFSDIESDEEVRQLSPIEMTAQVAAVLSPMPIETVKTAEKIPMQREGSEDRKRKSDDEHSDGEQPETKQKKDEEVLSVVKEGLEEEEGKSLGEKAEEISTTTPEELESLEIVQEKIKEALKDTSADGEEKEEGEIVEDEKEKEKESEKILEEIDAESPPENALVIVEDEEESDVRMEEENEQRGEETIGTREEEKEEEANSDVIVEEKEKEDKRIETVENETMEIEISDGESSEGSDAPQFVSETHKQSVSRPLAELDADKQALLRESLMAPVPHGDVDDFDDVEIVGVVEDSQYVLSRNAIDLEDEKPVVNMESTGRVLQILMGPGLSESVGDSPCASNYSNEQEAPDPNLLAYYLPARSTHSDQEDKDDKALVAAREAQMRNAEGLGEEDGGVIGGKKGRRWRQPTMPHNAFTLCCYLYKSRYDDDLLPSQRHLKYFAEVILNKINDTAMKEADPLTWFTQLYMVKSNDLINVSIYQPLPRYFERDVLTMKTSEAFEEWTAKREMSAQLVEEAVRAEKTTFKTLIETTLNLKDSFSIVRARSVFKNLQQELSEVFDDLMQDEEDENDEYKSMKQSIANHMTRIFVYSFYVISHSIGVMNRTRSNIQPYQLMRVLGYVLEGWVGWLERGGVYRVFIAHCEKAAKEGEYVPKGRNKAEMMRDKIESRLSSICAPIREMEQGGTENVVIYMHHQLKDKDILLESARSLRDGNNDGRTFLCGHNLGNKDAVCTLMFKSEQELQAHRNVAHSWKGRENTVATKCPKCTRYFLMKSALTLHLLVAHYDYDLDEEEDDEEGGQPSGDVAGPSRGDDKTVKVNKVSQEILDECRKVVFEWKYPGHREVKIEQKSPERPEKPTDE